MTIREQVMPRRQSGGGAPGRRLAGIDAQPVPVGV
jgi:hypothetical protein